MTPEIPLCCPPLPACTPSLRPEQSRRNLELTSLTRHQSPSHSIAADNTPVDTHCTIVGQVFQRRSHGRISWWHHVPPCKLSIDAVMDSCVIVGGLWVPSPIANNADKYMHNGSRIVMGALRSMQCDSSKSCDPGAHNSWSEGKLQGAATPTSVASFLAARSPPRDDGQFLQQHASNPCPSPSACVPDPPYPMHAACMLPPPPGACILNTTHNHL